MNSSESTGNQGPSPAPTAPSLSSRQALCGLRRELYGLPVSSLEWVQRIRAAQGDDTAPESSLYPHLEPITVTSSSSSGPANNNSGGEARTQHSSSSSTAAVERRQGSGLVWCPNARRWRDPITGRWTKAPAGSSPPANPYNNELPRLISQPPRPSVVTTPPAPPLTAGQAEQYHRILATQLQREFTNFSVEGLGQLQYLARQTRPDLLPHIARHLDHRLSRTLLVDDSVEHRPPPVVPRPVTEWGLGCWRRITIRGARLNQLIVLRDALDERVSGFSAGRRSGTDQSTQTELEEEQGEEEVQEVSNEAVSVERANACWECARRHGPSAIRLAVRLFFQGSRRIITQPVVGTALISGATGYAAQSYYGEEEIWILRLLRALFPQ